MQTKNILTSITVSVVLLMSGCGVILQDIYMSANYLPGMGTLITEYVVNGTKIGTGSGKRETPVTFVFITGHANTDNNVGDGKPKNQADLITAYCDTNKQYCLDYYSIDTHDMDDNYREDTGYNGNSTAYRGNFYKDWQDSHTLGVDWFKNKQSPGGSVGYGVHNS